MKINQNIIKKKIYKIKAYVYGMAEQMMDTVCLVCVNINRNKYRENKKQNLRENINSKLSGASGIIIL